MPVYCRHKLWNLFFHTIKDYSMKGMELFFIPIANMGVSNCCYLQTPFTTFQSNPHSKLLLYTCSKTFSFRYSVKSSGCTLYTNERKWWSERFLTVLYIFMSNIQESPYGLVVWQCLYYKFYEADYFFRCWQIAIKHGKKYPCQDAGVWDKFLI